MIRNRKIMRILFFFGTRPGAIKMANKIMLIIWSSMFMMSRLNIAWSSLIKEKWGVLFSQKRSISPEGSLLKEL
jgi:hypothetical protein